MTFGNELDEAARRLGRSPRTWLRIAWALAFAWVQLGSASAQVTPVGGIARNFTLADRRTGQPVQLYDFAGSIVVIDFFAYWCSPCQTSSPDLKNNVEDYYATRGGNAHGLPVVLLSANLEIEDPQSTDAFINGFHLRRVVDDYYRVGFDQFTVGPIPLFVVINGVAGLPARRQWEVLFRASGYPGAASLRTLIDSVAPSDLPGPPRVLAGPVPQARHAGEGARLEVMADGTRPLAYQWFKNDLPVGGNTNRLVFSNVTDFDQGVYSVTIGNALGSAASGPASVVVFQPGLTNVYASTNVPRAVPDYPKPGVTSELFVADDWDVSRLGVTASLTHVWTGDLAVYLTSPAGTTALVHPSTGEPGTRLDLNLADLPEFLGQRARGTWTLRVVDTTSPDTGALQAWALRVVHPPGAQRYEEWVTGYPGLGTTDPGGDDDGDGLSNFVEYLLEGFSPVARDVLPSPVLDLSDPDVVQLVVRLRPNTLRGLLSVQWSSAPSGQPWAEATATGGRVTVDRSVANMVTIRLRRDGEAGFVRLKGGRL